MHTSLQGHVNMYFLPKKMFLFLPFLSPICNASEDTKVYIDGNKIYYQGELNYEANQRLFDLYKHHNENVRWISIKSVGGEVNSGLDLADFINENHLNIEVNEYCLSSCANYIFTAANEKLISNSALIGFHGGTTGMSESVDKFILTLPESEQESARKKLNEYGIKTSKRETDFFIKINVNQAITTIGQSEKYKRFEELGNYIGWYYSINSLKKLGVTNISVLNPPWTFKQISEKSKFYKIDDDDIR